MKIAHLVLNYFPSVGGTQIFYQGISEHCVNTFHDEVEVLTVDSYFGSHSKQFKKIDAAGEFVNGVLVKRFPFYRWHKSVCLLLNKTLIKLGLQPLPVLNRYMIGPWSPSLKKAIDTTNADLISASSSSFLYMLYPLYRHRLQYPKPFVFQGAIHFAENDHAQVVADKTLEAIKASEYYMSNTTYEKERLVKLGVSEDMIVVAGVGVDMHLFDNGDRETIRETLGLTDDEVLVAYIGRLEAPKSIDILIKAFAVAYKENSKLRLLIAGFESAYTAQIKSQIDTLGTDYSSLIFLMLNISTVQKVNLYHALDIFVLPSVNESFGIVFLEAWSCKKPVIGTDIGAVASVVSDGVDGLLMKPFDEFDLSEKILKLADNPSMRNNFGANGFYKTKTNYTWDIITKKYRDTYLLAINKFNRRTKNYA